MQDPVNRLKFTKRTEDVLKTFLVKKNVCWGFQIITSVTFWKHWCFAKRTESVLKTFLQKRLLDISKHQIHDILNALTFLHVSRLCRAFWKHSSRLVRNLYKACSNQVHKTFCCGVFKNTLGRLQALVVECRCVSISSFQSVHKKFLKNQLQFENLDLFFKYVMKRFSGVLKKFLKVRKTCSNQVCKTFCCGVESMPSSDL